MTMAALVAMLALTAHPEPGQAPSLTPRPVIERFVELPDRTARVSLFNNRIAVVSQRDGDRHVLRRRLISHQEYSRWIELIESESPMIASPEVVPPGPDEPGRGVLRLSAGTGAPRVITYSLLGVQRLPLTRLLRALDVLETEVLETGPAQVELATWQPEVGDRVELNTGRRATVVRVEPNGVVVLEHDGTYLRELVPRSAWESVIRDLELEDE